MKKNSPETQKTFDAAAAFKLFDPHITGSITRQQFVKLHREIGSSGAKLTALDADECIGVLDSGHSGVVHFNDYMHLVLHPPPAGAAATERDVKKGKTIHCSLDVHGVCSCCLALT